VDQLREMCVEKSEAEALEGTLMDEAKTNAEDNIRKIFETALGKGYTITFVWKQ